MFGSCYPSAMFAYICICNNFEYNENKRIKTIQHQKDFEKEKDIYEMYLKPCSLRTKTPPINHLILPKIELTKTFKGGVNNIPKPMPMKLKVKKEKCEPLSERNVFDEIRSKVSSAPSQKIIVNNNPSKKTNTHLNFNRPKRINTEGMRKLNEIFDNIYRNNSKDKKMFTIIN